MHFENMSSATKFCSLVEMLRWRAHSEPTEIAYTFIGEKSSDEESITYCDLERQVQAIAGILQSLDMEGERVLLVYPTASADFIAAFFACLYARVIAVPVCPPRRHREGTQDNAALHNIAVDANARLILTTSIWLARFKKSFSSQTVSELQVMATDNITNQDDSSSRYLAPSITAGDIAYLQYTSGSTGMPKGVIITHGQVLNNLEYIDYGFQHKNDALAVSWLPHFHDMGLVYGIVQPIYNGFRSVLMSPSTFVREPLRWLDAISRYRATHSGGPNFSYDLCVRRVTPEERAKLDLSTWRIAFNGAEPVRDHTLRNFATTFASCGFRLNAFYPAYGLAEATLKVTGGVNNAGPVFMDCDAQSLEHNRAIEAVKSGPRTRTLVGCGSASLGTKVMILKPQSITPVPDCEIGEICISGPGVAAGYWGRSDTTGKIFPAELSDAQSGPILRTGDLGFLRNRELFVTGRLKDVIVIRGRNYDPADVELTAESSHPTLRPGAGAAFTIMSQGEERVVVVHEVDRCSRAIDSAVVCRAIRSAIAERHGLHTHTVMLLRSGSIPKTSSGKIRRKACKEAFIKGTMRSLFTSTADGEGSAFNTKEAKELLSQPELRVGHVHSEYLKSEIARILGGGLCEWNSDLTLLSLGLDSLMIEELRSRIIRDFNVDIDFTDFLKGMTIGQLIGRIERGSMDSSVAIQCADPADQVDMRVPCLGRETEPLPLSPEQERFWLLDQIYSQNPVYNIAAVIELSGELHWRKLQESIQQLITRQECLRASFETDRDGPVQQVSPAQTSVLSIIDIRQYGETDRPRIARDLARQLGSVPFRLNKPPLVRFSLILLGPNRHMLVVVAHHIIVDFASITILAKELLAIYECLLTGQFSARVPPLRIQYKDMIDWQVRTAKNEDSEHHLQYWKRTLAGASALQLPVRADEPSEADVSFHAAHREIEIPEAVGGSLRQLSRAEGVTLFVTLLAALKVGLCLCLRQEDITVGVPFQGRARPGTDELVGLFAYPVLLRTVLSDTATLRDLLRSVNDTVIAAHQHQAVPFAQVIGVANPRRSKGNTPLLAVMFRVIRLPVVQCAVADLSGRVREVQGDYTDCNLTVTICEDGGRLRGLITYRSDVLSETFVDLLRECYLEVLRFYGSKVDIRLHELRSEIVDVPALPTPKGQPRIVVSATFTADPITEPLSFWLKKLNIPASVELAPYNQVWWQLLDSSSLLRTNRNGINVILVRLEDWKRYEETPVSSRRSNDTERPLQDFVAAVKASAAHCVAPLLICICPSSPAAQSFKPSALTPDVESWIAEELASISGVHVISTRDITKSYPVPRYYDAIGDDLGHVPFTPLYFTALSTFLARKIYALQGQRYKMIVLDCDETLWKGVCSNDEEDVAIDGPRWALQEFMVKQHDAGMLLCLCSKNDERDVIRVFQRYPAMPLRREHIVAQRVNWRPKSENIRSLASELNIALESVIFVDDDPAECSEVEMHCPEVLVLKLPSNTNEIQRFLDHVWAFDHLKLTGEDQHRSAFYGQERERRQSCEQHLSLRDFVQSLDLEVTIVEVTPEQFGRAAQLTHRTTQFNTTGIRLGETDIQKIAMSDDQQCLVVGAQDRFGDYGLVGVMILSPGRNLILVETLLLSCRALGRRVEHKMLARVGEIAAMSGLEHIDVPFITSRRNQPAFDFLNAIAGGHRQEKPGGWLFRIPSTVAVALDTSFAIESTAVLGSRDSNK